MRRAGVMWVSVAVAAVLSTYGSAAASDIEHPRNGLPHRSVVPAPAGAATLGSAEETGLRNDAAEWFFTQRAAPAVSVSPDAYASLAGQAARLPTTPGTWRETTRGRYFTDSPAYTDGNDPAGSANSGSGDRFVSGRVTALARASDGALFTGVSSGGVWRSRDDGKSWQPLTDKAPTMSVGALAIDERAGSPYTVYVGTGEANYADSYAGVGVLRSTDGGNSFSRLGGTELNGALIFRIVVDPIDHRRLYVATTHGLYRFITGASTHWQRLLSFDDRYPGGKRTPINQRVWDYITDVLVVPGTGGRTGHVTAVAGWLGGASTNGVYQSTNGGDSFHFVGGFAGIVGVHQGRVSLAAGGAHQFYAVVQDTNFTRPTASVLGGVFQADSSTGPWRRVATSWKLENSGSAMGRKLIGIGYQPGVQATYNQFIGVDPGNSRHVYLGLEGVYESLDAGATWRTAAPYWNFTVPSGCFAYQPFEGTCNHRQAHSDQHAVLLAGGKIYDGNDGGVYSRPLTEHSAGNWTDLNADLRTLLFYSATGGRSASGAGVTVFGGMQDNGTGKFFPASTTVPDDRRQPLKVNGVQPFGGDGGYTVVDPKNADNVLTEYVRMRISRTNDGGHHWTPIAPGDPGALFIAPVTLDAADNHHIVAVGAYLWDTTKGFATNTSDWHKIYDLTSGGTQARVGTAVRTLTAGGVSTTYVGWCGPCDGPTFQNGIVVLNNAGGRWHRVADYGSAAGDLPPRYITDFTIDPRRAAHAYATLSGYETTFVIGPRDPGVGHVFELNSQAGTIRNVSGNLIDVPVDSVLLTRSGALVVGTDFGVFTSRTGGRTWASLGRNLPNVPVLQVSPTPDGRILAATHGRGAWSIAAP